MVRRLASPATGRITRLPPDADGSLPKSHGGVAGGASKARRSTRWGLAGLPTAERIHQLGSARRRRRPKMRSHMARLMTGASTAVDSARIDTQGEILFDDNPCYRRLTGWTCN